MMRPRHGDWLPSRAEVEAMVEAQRQGEEEALRQGLISRFEWCARRDLPGPGALDLPLFDGRTLAPSGRRVGRRRGGRDGARQP